MDFSDEIQENTLTVLDAKERLTGFDRRNTHHGVVIYYDKPPSSPP